MPDSEVGNLGIAWGLHNHRGVQTNFTYIVKFTCSLQWITAFSCSGASIYFVKAILRKNVFVVLSVFKINKSNLFRNQFFSLKFSTLAFVCRKQNNSKLYPKIDFFLWTYPHVVIA